MKWGEIKKVKWSTGWDYLQNKISQVQILPGGLTLFPLHLIVACPPPTFFTKILFLTLHAQWCLSQAPIVSAVSIVLLLSPWNCENDFKKNIRENEFFFFLQLMRWWCWSLALCWIGDGLWWLLFQPLSRAKKQGVQRFLSRLHCHGDYATPAPLAMLCLSLCQWASGEWDRI